MLLEKSQQRLNIHTSHDMHVAYHTISDYLYIY